MTSGRWMGVREGEAEVRLAIDYGGKSSVVVQAIGYFFLGPVRNGEWHRVALQIPPGISEHRITFWTSAPSDRMRVGIQTEDLSGDFGIELA